MKSLASLLSFLLVMVLAAAPLQAQVEYWYEQDPLPRGMTAEEELRRDEIGLHFRSTPPPAGPVRNIAEFERNEAALIRYPLGITLSLVAALAEHVRVITLVNGPAQQTQASNVFQGAGVNMDNVEFLHAPTNSVWTRDYGPFYIADENHQVGIVDFIYNRPRPFDDAVPEKLGAHLDVPVFGMNLVHTGGNYMTDAWGISASTDLIWEENNFNQELVLSKMSDYVGIDTYHVTIDPMNPNGIKHIDTWAKFLDVDKVLITEVPPSDPRYDDYEEVAEYFESQVSAWGTPYQVFRVYSPNGQPYTNSLVLNERVYVPIVNSPWDQAALAVYEDAMPGYEVLGFTGSWLSNDALHCRVKEIADREMLHLAHVPVVGELKYEPEIELQVDIIPYSGEPLIGDELYLIFRTEGRAAFDTLALGHVGDHTFSASLPVDPAGGQISYYFSAADESGRKETFPLIGPDGARTFTVEPEPIGTEPTIADAAIALDAPYPNPSTGPATLRYHIASGGPVRLIVYDVLGREVARLVDDVQTAGWHTAQLPAHLGAGTYVVQLSSASEALARRFSRIN